MSDTRKRVRDLSREECHEELRQLAKRNAAAKSSRAARRGLTTDRRIDNYETALNSDRASRLITAADHSRALQLIDQLRFFARVGTATAAERLGLKPEQFRRLAEKIGLKPVAHYENPHYSSGPPCPLWRESDIERLVGSEHVSSLLQRSEKLAQGKREAPQRRQTTLEQKYGTDWRRALPEAAEALFNLNRYAKWKSCRGDHSQEIYDLKNALIQVLHDERLETRIGLHEVKQQGKTCYGCSGTGSAPYPTMAWNGGEDDEDSGDDGGCSRCDGIGWYLPPGTLTYVVFSFVVAGRSYCWHQPEELVTWDYELTEEQAGTNWQPTEEQKPINMPAGKFAQAKSLIRFVLNCAERDPSLNDLITLTSGAGSAILADAQSGDEDALNVWLDWISDNYPTLPFCRRRVIRQARKAGCFSRSEGAGPPGTHLDQCGDAQASLVD